MKRFILLFNLIVLIYFNVNASVPYKNLQFYHLGIEQGLSNNDVTCLIQSRSGFIWIGTYDGLNRFDGYRLTSFRRELSTNSISLPNNRIESLLETRKGNLLIGTLNAVISYDTFKELFYEPIVNNKSKFEGKAIFKEYGDKTFIGSSKYGLTYSLDDKSYYSIPLIINKKRITTYNVVGMDITSNGVIWLVVKGVGLCRYKKGDPFVNIVDGNVQNVSGLYINDDVLYVYEDKYIKQLNLISNIWQQDVIEKPVLNISKTRNNEILVSTDGGGVYSRDEHNGFYPKISKEKNGLLSNSVKQVLEDSNGNLWCASLRGGITVFTNKKSQFHSLLPINATINGSNLYVSSFAKSSNRDIWVGSDGLGLFKWDRTNNLIKPVFNETLSNKGITNLLTDKIGRLWVLTWGSGIYRFDTKGEVNHYDCVDSGVKRNNVWSLYEDKSGDIWVSTFGEGGLFRWNERSNKFELVSNTIGNVLCFHETQDGQFLLGNDDELIVYDRSTGGYKKYAIGYRIRSVVEDKQTGFLWIATEGNGLLSLNTGTGKYKRYTESEGLANNNVNQILSDHDFLWLSTFNGISKFDLNTKKFTSFDVEDGLQSNQFSYNAGLKISNDEFVFGGLKGITSFNPQMSLDEDSRYPTQIAKLTINDQSLSQYVKGNESAYYRNTDSLTTLVIPHDAANLKIELTAFPYFNTNKVKYDVKLVGHDPKWVELENHPIVTYNKLEPGKYVFKARVIGKDGNWKESTLLLVTVLSPWYLTWWAKFLYFMTVMLVLYIIYSVKQTRTKLKYEAQLSQLAYENERDLNIKKMNVFSEIVNELRNPLTFVINPLKSYLKNNNEDVEIKNALQNANKLLVLAEQLIPYQLDGNEIKQLKLEQVDLFELIDNEVNALRVSSEKDLINIHFEQSRQTAVVTIDKDKIAMAVFNVLIFMLTTFKVESTLFIDLEETENDFWINFYDSRVCENLDIGESTIDMNDVQDFGVGISLTEDFVKLHQGTFNINSSKKSIEIRLRKGDWFSSEHSRIWNNFDQEPVVVKSVPLDNKFEISTKKTILLIDNNEQFISYFKKMVGNDFYVVESNSWETITEQLSTIKPSLIISEFFLNKSGIVFSSKIKQMNDFRHIPIILLTAVGSDNDMIEAMESGANDVLRKPVDEKLFVTKIKKLVAEQEVFEDYFLNQITHQYQSDKISVQEKEFLDHCIYVISQNFQNEMFNAKELALQCNMSYSNLYKKIKHLCGLSISEFIRSVRLRRAAELILQSQMNISEVALEVGFLDLKYFREKFKEVYGLSPSQYLKEHRIRFNKKYRIYSN